MSDQGIKIYPDATGHDNQRQSTIENKERGCGFLEEGKAYIRGVIGRSGIGVLPAFVKCEPAIPFREIGTEGSFTRAYKEIDGLTFQLATEGEVTEYVPLSPNASYEDLDHVWDNMIQGGLYQSRMDIPESEVQRHIDRIQYRGPEGGHWGGIPTAGQTDLLMRCGGTYYPEPEDFIEECRTMGLSKAIPVGPNRGPPEIVPGITRCWVMHPTAGGDGYGGAIIGYVYLDETIFTRPEDGQVPAYIDELEEQNNIRTVDIGPPIPKNGEQHADISDFGGESEHYECGCGETFDSEFALSGHRAHCDTGSDNV